ncbi:MAG: hypothetical protein JJU45_04980 [Acidimicrobiia bacterium]|nr:hypothetical protein [Acidimicrobiia bacterium]
MARPVNGGRDSRRSADKVRLVQRVALAVAVLVAVAVLATAVERTLWAHEIDAEVVDVRRSSVGWGNMFLHTLTVEPGGPYLIDRHVAAALEPGAEIRTERFSATVWVDGEPTSIWGSGELWRALVAVPLALGSVAVAVMVGKRGPPTTV